VSKKSTASRSSQDIPVSNGKNRRSLLDFDPVLDEIYESDAAWFRANPNRDYRFRPSFSGEPEGLGAPPARPGYRWWTLVRQVQPHLRVRALFQIEPNEAWQAADDFVLQALADRTDLPEIVERLRRVL
jgi:hypothetical protein